MKSGEKKAHEQSKFSEVPAFRVPTSLAEAYELGWQWERESFVGLREFGTTKEGVVRREGLALFVSGRKTDSIVIPFVATYEFGTPRYPKYPYTGGSVCLIDDDEEHAATLERKAAMFSRGVKVGKGDEPASSDQATLQKSAEEIEEERIAIWRIKQRFRGRVIFSYTHPGPESQRVAIAFASDAFCDDLLLEISEVKPKKPTKGRRVKKQKPRR